MIKTLSNIFKQDKEKFVIPRSVQQVIPIETIWSDGIFKIGRNKFARTYKFTDINYAVASKVDKETMFLEYMDLLNSFDCGGTTNFSLSCLKILLSVFIIFLASLLLQTFFLIFFNDWFYRIKIKI